MGEREGHRERKPEAERQGERDFFGVFSFKDTNPIRSGPPPF